ncbi:MAG: hypothetical protein A4E59_01522 [Syntrophorhabdus sp. PtaB.Bin027]|nr:MAG: hypothetical protein A4E59_01522 [Syntrophorhabdus sp. PtaB.Bin027]OQB78489.1 MAG: hypothetical protein BWX92_00105 [Deltaproteobacteria bacterium ADurb.Bin135]
MNLNVKNVEMNLKCLFSKMMNRLALYAAIRSPRKRCLLLDSQWGSNSNHLQQVHQARAAQPVIPQIVHRVIDPALKKILRFLGHRFYIATKKPNP